MNLALSVRSDHSIGESVLQIDQMLSKASELGIQAIGMVDTNLSGVVDFSTKCAKKGIKPIIGVRIRVYDDPTYFPPAKSTGIKPKANKYWTAKIYVKDERAMPFIFAMMTRADKNFYYHPRIGLDDLLALEHVCVSTGDFYGLFSHPNYEEIYSKLESRFEADLYAEICPVNTPLWDRVAARAIKLPYSPNFLVTYPTLYATNDDADTCDVIAAIVGNVKMDEGRRPQQFIRDFSFDSCTSGLKERIKEAAKRQAQFHGIKTSTHWVAGLKNAYDLANKCNYEFKRKPMSLPTMASDEFETLKGLCRQGLAKRMKQPVLGYTIEASELPRYAERLRYELSVLKKMNFSGYFLLVADLVTWAKENGVIVGPGRGSVGGSLVAYLLGITDVDPLRFNLFFERFINPDRIDLPDADLDFMSSKRHLVIEYLIGRYGEKHVAGISNYATLASASAFRDTGRVFGLLPYEMSATKLVPKENGVSHTLTEAAAEVPEIQKLKEDFPKIWHHATKLEGAMRNFGQHAAGVVVAGCPIVERAALATQKEGLPVVNWDKRTVEDWGLIKIDLLGLSTLDVLEIAKQYIFERHGIEVDYLSIDLGEEEIMDAFGKGLTTGVFQFESPGMKELLRDLRKGGELTFDDITAATALYRPGPMESGLMEQFVKIKQGISEPYYEHPNMAPALVDTLGVIVYQEQVMQIARDVAGYSMADADKLRKIMGKKDKDAMEKERIKWIAGCVSQSSMSEASAGALFDKIEKFAGYGFNKSHACEYSIISYWTMWLRVRYPAEYFAACMSIASEEKLPGLVNDAKEVGIDVLPPDINISTSRFMIHDGAIVAPFSSVKGCSELTADAIVRLRDRAGGAFKSEAEFVDLAAEKGSKVNTKVVTNLNLVGALVGIQPPGTPGALDISRRKAQLELLPGLIIESVKADRVVDMSATFAKEQVVKIVRDYASCVGCELQGKPHPTVRMKDVVKFMVVTDGPSWEEERDGKLLVGDSSKYVKQALLDVGLSAADGYFTTLVKAKKEGKFYSNSQINACSAFLNAELDLLKPPVIVVMGSASMKRFLPDIKGGSEELRGKAYYQPEHDRTIVVGFNPAMIFFKPHMAEELISIFRKVSEIVN